MTRPQQDEYAPSYRGYVDLVPDVDILEALDTQVAAVRRLASGALRQKETFAYAAGKWTIRQVAGHLGDGERVFGFRAFCFSRGDKTPLPGFDEKAYVAQSRFNDVPLSDLVEEFAFLRSANLGTLRVLREEQWMASGVANGKQVTVRALAYVMAGHVRHHLQVLRDRYGVDVGT